MDMERWSSCSSSISGSLRLRLLEFLLHASDQVGHSLEHQHPSNGKKKGKKQIKPFSHILSFDGLSPLLSQKHLRLRPIVKYTALSFFADRFLPSLPRKASPVEDSDAESWLLKPLRESNLQLFALISVWVSSKIHDTLPLSVKSLKALGDRLISDQHFTTRDFVEGELVFLEVLKFEVGTSNVSFIYLEDLLIQFRELSKLGELVNLGVCMEVMDLLYETDETSILFGSPYSLAACVLVSAYVISVTRQQWEFPLLPWVKFTTSYDEEHIGRIVMSILRHVLKPEAMEL